jgi:hypothetical protein
MQELGLSRANAVSISIVRSQQRSAFLYYFHTSTAFVLTQRQITAVFAHHSRSRSRREGEGRDGAGKWGASQQPEAVGHTCGTVLYTGALCAI